MLRLSHTCTGHRAALYALARGRSERQLCSAGGDGWIVAWDLDAPDPGRVVADVGKRVFSLCTLDAGNRLVAGDMDGGLHWIDLDAPARSRDVSHHRKGVFDLLPVGGQLFSAGGDGLLTRWDASGMRAVESLQLSAQALRCLAFSAARGELAAGASDGNIYFVDVETLALTKTLSAAHSNSVFTVAWSPDERFLLSGGRDAMLRAWADDQGDKPVSEQPAHWFTLNHLAFSPDGRFFATASRDKTIRLWRTDGFSLVKTLDTIHDGGHIHSVNRLLWLPDALISCSDDHTVRIWQESGRE